MELIPGSRIKQIRLYLGQSQDEFSKKLGVSQFTLSNYECGKRFPDTRFLRKMKELIKVDLNWLCGGDELVPGECPGMLEDKEIVDFLYWFKRLPIVTHSMLSNLEMLKLQHPEAFKRAGNI